MPAVINLTYAEQKSEYITYKNLVSVLRQRKYRHHTCKRIISDLCEVPSLFRNTQANCQVFRRNVDQKGMRPRGLSVGNSPFKRGGYSPPNRWNTINDVTPASPIIAYSRPITATLFRLLRRVCPY